MKKLLTLALIAISAASLSAATVSLDWSDNPTSQGVTGYTVYEDNGDGTFDVVATSVTSDADVAGVVPGVHTYVVTAGNVWGESGASNAVTTPEAATPPQGLTIVVIVP